MQPTQLGPFTITGTLGKGGMGAVYEATDTRTGGQVAVKTLAAHLGDEPALRRRFLAEIDVLKSLRHPGIVQLLAFGEEDGIPYFAMELVRGRSLEQLLRAGKRFGWRETIDVALAITRALKSAHDHGVVHRDLKPANLLFPDAAAADQGVKLADFGIARLFGGSDLTVAGMVVGTAEYMAPEQAAGNPLDHRVDLYALGLVIYAMLTGRPPFRGGEATDVLRRQRTEPAPRLSAALADIPPALDDLVDRLLAKDPARRPAGALAVGRLLSAIDCSSAATAPEPPGDDVDLLAPTRIDAGPGVVIGSLATSRGTDGDAATMPVPTPAATDDASAGGRARRATEPDRDQAAYEPRPTTSRFVTLEDLHRAAHEAERVRRGRDVALRLMTGIGIAAVLAVGGYALLRQPTADELHTRMMTLAGDPAADPRDARPLIDAFLAAHADDPRAAAVRDVEHRLDLDSLELRVRRRRLGGRPLPPVEREYRAAMEREADGPEACIEALEAVLALHPEAGPVAAEASLPPEERTSLWLDLVRRQLATLRRQVHRDRDADRVNAAATLTAAEALAAEAATAPDARTRAEIDRRRRDLLAGLVALYGDKPHVAEVVDQARAELAGLPAAPEDAPPP